MLKLLILFSIHGIFILSVLDIFFKTTIYTDLKPIYSDEILHDINNYSHANGLPLADEHRYRVDINRVILFVCDGLPADYVYEVKDNNFTHVPFLRNIIEEKGSWGLSFTRVPTESRPGHVALLAGHYEDPSAIFWGWQDNLVNFDSLFNRTDTSFAWGCEDILQLFEKRTTPEIMHAYKYPSSWQDYSGMQGTAELLDSWVRDEFTTFLSNARSNDTLKRLISKPKTVFFFHLLGMDVGGHAYKPKTEFYYNTLRSADNIIQNISNSINNFFSDQKTTFIFTSDHGMTDWGSHGAGSPIETITPIVAWGAGIKEPMKRHSKYVSKHGIYEMNGNLEKNPSNWGLDSLLRIDVNQADIAVLMSVLLDIPIPVNSLGVLPKDILAIPHHQLALKYFSNAMQLLQQYVAKEKECSGFFFKRYMPLSNEQQGLIIRDIKHRILIDDYYGVISETDNLILKIFDGLKYYDNYYQQVYVTHLIFGFFCVGMIIVGKILHSWNYLELRTAGVYAMSLYSKGLLMYFICVIGQLVTILSLLVETFPIHYLLYFQSSLLLFLWSLAENPWYWSIVSLLANAKFVFILIVYIFGVQFMVLSFFNREVLSLGLTLISIWPFHKKYLNSALLKDKIKWCGLCLLLAVFPFLPIVQNKEIIEIKIIAALLWYFTIRFHLRPSLRFRICLQILWIISTINMMGIYLYFSLGIGYILVYQTLSFVFSAMFLISICFGPNITILRFQTISFSLGMCFLQFALSYEAFLPFIMSKLLYLWINYEKKIHLAQVQEQFRFADSRSNGRISNEDVRRSFFFIFFVFVSFFGIGNLTSINSFNTDWVKGFVTSFQPFVMMSLIILRTILPIFMVTCAFKFVILSVNVVTKPMFYIVLLFCDVAAAELLLSVQNTGSWLDIGTSLSRFIIMQVIVLFLLLLYFIVEFVTKGVIPDIYHRGYVH